MEGKKAIAIRDVKRQYQCARSIGQRLEDPRKYVPPGAQGVPLGPGGYDHGPGQHPRALGGYPQDPAGTPVRVWIRVFALFSQLLEAMFSRENSEM